MLALWLRSSSPTGFGFLPATYRVLPDENNFLDRS